MRRVENFTTFMCRLSRNSGTSTSWNPKGLSRPVAESFTFIFTYFEYTWTCGNGGMRFSVKRILNFGLRGEKERRMSSQKMWTSKAHLSNIEEANDIVSLVFVALGGGGDSPSLL